MERVSRSTEDKSAMMANASGNSNAPSTPPPAAVSGVQLAQGIGVQEAKGFWADAW
jgi:hypothetical protein